MHFDCLFFFLFNDNVAFVFHSQSNTKNLILKLFFLGGEQTKLEISQLNGFGAFEDENTDDIKRLALEFERKYGDTYKGCGPNKRRMNTSVYDKGSGYDQSDPFIDDAIKVIYRLFARMKNEFLLV